MRGGVTKEMPRLPPPWLLSVGPGALQSTRPSVALGRASLCLNARLAPRPPLTFAPSNSQLFPPEAFLPSDSDGAAPPPADVCSVLLKCLLLGTVICQ